MMTKRFLSYSKWRSIRGKVPLPIEPKPIMTMGPEIFAWTCAVGDILGKFLRDGFVTGGGTNVPASNNIRMLKASTSERWTLWLAWSAGLVLGVLVCSPASADIAISANDA